MPQFGIEDTHLLRTFQYLFCSTIKFINGVQADYPLTNHPIQQESFYWIIFICTPNYFKDGRDKSNIFIMIVNLHVSRQVLKMWSQKFFSLHNLIVGPNKYLKAKDERLLCQTVANCMQATLFNKFMPVLSVKILCYACNHSDLTPLILSCCIELYTTLLSNILKCYITVVT